MAEDDSLPIELCDFVKHCMWDWSNPHVLSQAYDVHAYVQFAVLFFWLIVIVINRVTDADKSYIAMMAVALVFECVRLPFRLYVGGCVAFVRSSFKDRDGALVCSSNYWFSLYLTTVTLAFYIAAPGLLRLQCARRETPETFIFYAYQKGLNVIVFFGSLMLGFSVFALIAHYTFRHRVVFVVQGPTPAGLLDCVSAEVSVPEREESFDCAVCLSECETGDLVRRLACGHYFHRDCAKRWLSMSCSCPFRCQTAFHQKCFQLRESETLVPMPSLHLRRRLVKFVTRRFNM